jgi:hypothetical protein
LVVCAPGLVTVIVCGASGALSSLADAAYA